MAFRFREIPCLDGFERERGSPAQGHNLRRGGPFRKSGGLGLTRRPPEPHSLIGWAEFRQETVYNLGGVHDLPFSSAKHAGIRRFEPAQSTQEAAQASSGPTRPSSTGGHPLKAGVLQEVCTVTSSSGLTSTTDVPVSACLNAKTISSSVNRLCRNRSASSRTPTMGPSAQS